MNNSPARMHDPLLMRFTSPDPLASKYPDLSPWAHTAANPVNLVDPSGMNIYKFDERGNLICIEEDNTFDTVEILYDNGQSIQSESMPKGTIKSHNKYNDGEGGYYDIIKAGNGINGRNLFEFFSENTNIEYGLFITGNNGEGPSFITTSHKKDEESAAYWLFKNQLRFGYNIISKTHNHPEGSPPSENDIKISNQISQYLNGKRIKSYIYRKVQDVDNSKNFHYEYTPY